MFTLKLVEKATTISTNPVFLLKHNGNAFQAHLCLLSSHVYCETVSLLQFYKFIIKCLQ